MGEEERFGRRVEGPEHLEKRRKGWRSSRRGEEDVEGSCCYRYRP